MNDREFVCSRTILLYFFRTGLFIKAGAGGGGGGEVFVGKVYLRSSTLF